MEGIEPGSNKYIKYCLLMAFASQ